MKCRMYLLLLIFVYSFTFGIAPQQEAAILNGFEQFLGKIYQYKSEQLLGGLSSNTQHLYIVNNNKYVVRIIGAAFPKRYSEVNIHRLAAEKRIAPKIYYCDDDCSFFIMDFVEGHTIYLEEANKFEVLDSIAQKVQLITQLDGNAYAYEGQWNLFGQINSDYKKVKKQQEVVLGGIIQQTFDRMNIIYQSLQKEHRPLVFCHNDLNCRNVFFTNNDIQLIDWEMAGINYEFYDLAYYSVFLCLKEKDDLYLLTKYLEHQPSCDDIDYFKRIKLMVRVCNAFYLLAFLEYVPESMSMESVKNIEFYAQSLAQDATVACPEFLYKIAVSQLRLFHEEYERIV